MIDKLNILNFQSHKDTTLEFDPGVNIIVGSSDSGKTAVIRALRWLVWNRPSGDAFRSNWGGDTKVEIDLNGISVSRFKGKENLYQCDGVDFTAFGAEVPFEVRHHLNVGEINLQEQLDRPFLLTESPGEVARYFNKVANLDQIDQGIKNVQKRIREIEQETKSTISNREELEESLKQYEHLDKMEMDVEVLEGLENQKAGKVMQIQRLQALIKECQTLESDIDHYADVIKMDDDVSKILKLIDDHKANTQNIQTLDDLIDEIYEISESIESTEKIIFAEKKVNDLIELHKEEENQEKEYNSFNHLVLKIEDIENRIAHKEGKLKEREEEFHKEMPDVCPLCNQKIKK